MLPTPGRLAVQRAVVVLSAVLAAAAILAILVVAWALWDAVARWEAAALDELALEDPGMGGRLGVPPRADWADGGSASWSLVGEQRLACSIATCFADDVVEEITIEHPKGDAVLLHPTDTGGWK